MYLCIIFLIILKYPYYKTYLFYYNQMNYCFIAKNTLRLFFCCVAIFYCPLVMAQSPMTDSQVVSFVIEQHKSGKSQQDILQSLKRKGVTVAQLQRIKRNYENGEALGNTDSGIGTTAPHSRTRAQNGELRQAETTDIATSEMSIEDISFLSSLNSPSPKRQIFGHDVFNKKNLTFESSMNLPTPQNYVLGAGDAVNIDIWGASQESVTEVISPDGTIVIDGVGVIQLSGMTVAQAKAKLKKELGARYQDSQIDLTLGQTRTITISVMGEVKVPGTYTMSAFASVFNALYMAGGPNDIGTLRSVKVYRKGKLQSTIDVYDYLLNGKLTGDIHLQDADVITVSPYEALVCVVGKVKRPMYYEMKKSETAATLINYSGGFTGDAYAKAIRVNRKAGNRRSVFSVGEFDLNQFKLMDEDSVTVDSTINRYENMVEIRGAVFRPGMYQVGGNISTVKGLVEAASGLTEGAISQHLVMHRMKADRTLEAMSIDFRGITEGSVPDVTLHNEDVIFVPTRDELNEKKTLTIKGEVAYPGVYRYAANATIEDVILQAGGPTEAASLSKVDVFRRVVNPNAMESTDSITRVFSFKINPDFTVDNQMAFTLQPFDEIHVRRSPGYNVQQNITVEGEVQFEGIYTMTSKEQRLSEAIQMAGGLTKHAYLKGAKLLRQMTQEERDVLETVLRTAARNSGNDSIDISKLMSLANYPVGIELDKALKNPGTSDDPILREGDRIVVPQYTSTVTVNGDVLYPNTVRFKEGKSAKYYINQAGGATSTAKKSKAIIIYMNGMVAKANSKHKPMPGCQIVVPTKRKGHGLSLTEIMAIGTSSAAIGTMIATVANLMK